MATLNTPSTLSLGSGENKTSTALSTNIIIRVNGRAVGAIQSLNVKEARPVKQIDEVGTDGHIDSCPTGSTNITGSCKRIRFDRLRIAEAFGRGFVHVSSQVYPFDFEIVDKQKRNANSQIVTVVKNVWITDIDTDYSVGDWIITDNMSWQAETIYSFTGGGTLNAASGGEIGMVSNKVYGFNGADSENIEQLVDRGANGRRGSMDTSGIIDIVGIGGSKLY